MNDQQEFRKALERGDKGAIDHAVIYYPQSLDAGWQANRIAELEDQNKILSDSIMAGTNVYKRQLKNAETESRNRGRALKEIIRLASEYTTIEG